MLYLEEAEGSSALDHPPRCAAISAERLNVWLWLLELGRFSLSMVRGAGRGCSMAGKVTFRT